MRTNKPTYKTDQWQQQHSSVYIDTFRNIFHAKTGMSFWVLVVSFFSLSLHFFLYNWTSFLLRKSFFFPKKSKKKQKVISTLLSTLFLNNTKNQSIYQRISHQMISQLVTFKKKNGLLILLFTIFLFNSCNLDYHPYY